MPGTQVARLRIATGTNSFKEIVTTSDVFVDKTLFIKEIIDSGDKAILITRPRRWGKSLGLDMLKAFLAIEADESGNKLEVNPNKVLFEGGSVTVRDQYGDDAIIEVKPTNIAKLSSAGMRGQGNFPVIHVSFKDVRALIKDEANKLLKNAIRISFNEHSYLYKSDKLSRDQKALLEYYREEFLKDAVLEESRLKESIKFLSELLETQHQRKVYILVDEYDKPVNYFFETSLIQHVEERNIVAGWVTSILGAAGKDNKALEKIVMVGIMDAFQKRGSSDFNNVAHYSISDDKFSSHFGFSEEEVQQLLGKFDMGPAISRSALRNIQEWYNGYGVEIEGEGRISVYNPWAVMRYISASYNTRTGVFIPHDFKSYWSESGTIGLLRNLEQLRPSLIEEVKALSQGEGCKVIIPSSRAFNLLNALERFEANQPQIIAYLLFSSGYITKSMDGKYRVPNHEVALSLTETILPVWVQTKYGIDLNAVMEQISDSLHDATEFQDRFQELILNKMEGADRTEADFQALVGAAVEFYAIRNSYRAGYKFFSEKTVHKSGRIDNIFYPNSDEGGSVIIHEYKKLDRAGVESIQILNEALWQILEKRYLDEPLARISEHGSYHKWNAIKIRSVVFKKDGTSGKWSIGTMEKDLTRREAELVSNFFKNPLFKAALGSATGTDLMKKLFEMTSISNTLDLVESILTLRAYNSLRVAIISNSLTIKNKSKAKAKDILSIIDNQSALEPERLLSHIREEMGFDFRMPINTIKLMTKKAPALGRIEPPRKMHRSGSLESSTQTSPLVTKEETVDRDSSECICSHKGAGAAGVKLTHKSDCPVRLSGKGSSVEKPDGGMFAEYNIEGIDRLLRLRLASIPTVRVDRAVVISMDSLAKSANALSVSLNHLAIDSRAIIPILYNNHWAGFIISKQGTVQALYIDSENNPIPPALELLLRYSLPTGLSITFAQEVVRPQSYSNNCGPELIEYFAETLTGSRVSESLVPYAHSDLLARALYAEANYMTRPVGLSAPQAVAISSALTLGSSSGGSDSIHYSFIDTMSNFANRWFGSQLKHFVHRGELSKLSSILSEHGIEESIGEVLSDKGFRKVALRLHPDKEGGSASDFAFAQDLKKKWQQDVDIKPLIDAGIQKYQPVLYKTTIGFKALDIAVDVVSFYQEPQVDDGKKLMVSSMHLYSMYSGSYLSILPAAISVIDTYMKSGAVDALSEASTHAAYILLPSMLIVSNPYIGFAYTAAITGITAYNAVSNAYDLYQTSYGIEQDSTMPLENMEPVDTEQAILSGDIVVNI